MSGPWRGRRGGAVDASASIVLMSCLFIDCRASARLQRATHFQVQGFRSPTGERVTFLCSCKEKSPKETHPRHRTCAVRKCPVLLAGAGPARTRASLRSDRRAFPPSSGCDARCGEGGEDQEPSKSTARALDLALDLRAPFATASARRKGPQGGRDGSRPVRCQHQGRAVSEPRSALAHLRGFIPQAWQRGRVSFGYLSLHEQRKVTRSPQGEWNALLWKLPACCKRAHVCTSNKIPAKRTLFQCVRNHDPDPQRESDPAVVAERGEARLARALAHDPLLPDEQCRHNANTGVVRPM